MKSVVALLLAALLALTSGAARAGKEWTDQNRALQATLATVTFMDYLQSRGIVKHPDRYGEGSPLLPQHPSMAQLNRHFAMVLGLQYFMIDRVDSEARVGLQGIWISVESSAVVWNHSADLQFNPAAAVAGGGLAFWLAFQFD